MKSRRASLFVVATLCLHSVQCTFEKKPSFSLCSLHPNTFVTNGQDVEHFTVQPSAEACKARCESEAGCCLGEFDGSNQHCYLKYGGALVHRGSVNTTSFDCPTRKCQAPPQSPTPAPPQSPTPAPPTPPPAPPAPAPHDTSGLVGAEYTPWRAGNQLWWLNFTAYRADVQRDLRSMSTKLGFTAIRVFLHDHLWQERGDGLVDDLQDFLSLCEDNGLRVGFVFFDDCWQHNADLSKPCVPTQGVHNGCWLAAPQDARRHNGTVPFEGYVRGIVRALKADPRVAWWEIFNEPQRGNTFSLALRDAAYRWAKDEAPLAPVISCWDDSNNTDIVDHHQYYVPSYTNYLSNAVFSNPAKGGIVTEAGCRWYQGTSSDSGSPLVTVNWLDGLKRNNSGAPFVPGVMLSWEVMVGHSMTRWHWGTSAGAAEPALPWCGSLYPDGTPVSYTEAAALRRYTRGPGHDDFLFLATFQNASAGAAAPEAFLLLHPTWDCTVAREVGCYDDHRRILPTPIGGDAAMDHAACAALCHDAAFQLAGLEYGDQCWCGQSIPPSAAKLNASSCEMPCAGEKTEQCGGPYAINVFEPHCTPAPPSPRVPDSTVWPGWMPEQPPKEALYEVALWPEALPAQLVVDANGVQVTVDAVANGTATLAISARQQYATPLAQVNVTQRLVVGGWNILRVLCKAGRVQVWLNPNFADVVGASAPPADLQRAPQPPAPLVDSPVPSAGTVALVGLNATAPLGAWRLDYASVLPPVL